MKRLLTSAVLFLCCVATSFAQFSGSGSGTENDPYLILNPIQLNQMRNFLNKEGVYFKLMADIDLTEFIEEEDPLQGWQPINSFSGELDGNGKTISGLWINRPNDDDIGFFKQISTATVKNLNLVTSFIKGKNRVGILAGKAQYANITNCVISGILNGETNIGGCVGFCEAGNSIEGVVCSISIEAKENIGGIIGKIYINNSSNSIISACKLIDGKISGSNNIGGICGDTEWYSNSRGHIEMYDSFVSANIKGNNNVGGICGKWSGPIIRSSFCGKIIASSYVGGICGYGSGGGSDIEKCYALGEITASGNNIGGIGGYVGQSITSCYFNGHVEGGENIGGLVGYKNSYLITKNLSIATIVGEKNIGGLCGYAKNNTEITSNIVSAQSIKATYDFIGRIYGYKDLKITVGETGTINENKAWNRTIVIKAGVAQEITSDLQNGTGVSATTLKLKATYVAMGWDFNDTWEIQETECYPYFKTQTAPPVITSQVVSGATNISGKCVDGGTVTLEIDGVKQQMVSTGNTFSFTVSPLQAGHEVRISAKAEGKEQSYYTTEIVSYLGKGTEADPYQVYTAADLTGVYRKGFFKLMNDIDLTDYINQFSPTEGWQSIGRDGSETIHFDGNGHKITGLWCNTTRDNTGLFSCFANGTIKNLTVDVASGKQVKGDANTGILIGKMINGTIENCRVSGTVADGTPVGGMVGLFDGGKILKCQASVTINTTESTTYAGGLVGEITGGEIDQCYTGGSLTATGDESYAGGLVGKNSGTITNCYSSAVVTSSYNAAGLVAYNFGVVDKCMVSGNLYSNNYAAGVIGYNDGAAAVISNSVALNNIIDVTYESQQIQQGGGYGQRIIGGIKNGAPAPEMNNYALSTMQVSLNDVPQKVYDDIMNGTAKTNAELKQKATYQTIGWDFDNIWNIDEGTSYPYQTIKINSGSDPNDPNDPNDPTNIDVTDVSQIDNVIYVDAMEEICGKQTTISLKMKNTVPIRGFQFDLYLPEGATVVKSDKGRIQGALSAGRLPEEDEHNLTFSEQQDGAIRFLCSSQYNETFTGNEGEIATLQIRLADDMADGDYAIVLKDVKLTETDINKFYETEKVVSKLTIISYIMGDISGDGKVDVSDYTGVANYIHNNPPAGFNAKAADVDENGKIDVSDYTGIANIIHTGSVYGYSNTNNVPRRSGEENQPDTDVSTIDNVIYISPFTVSAGTQTTLSIKMKNKAAIRGFQFDLYLPEGMTAVKSSKGRIQGVLSAGRLPDEDEHDLTFSEQADGAIRFLCSSQYDETFTGTEGEIATLQVNVAAGMADGDYALLLREVKLTETDISKFYETELVKTTVTVGSSSGIDVVLDENDTVWYTLDGRKLDKKPTAKGVYINNGCKIVIK